MGIAIPSNILSLGPTIDKVVILNEHTSSTDLVAEASTELYLAGISSSSSSSSTSTLSLPPNGIATVVFISTNKAVVILHKIASTVDAYKKSEIDLKFKNTVFELTDKVEGYYLWSPIHHKVFGYLICQKKNKVGIELFVHSVFVVKQFRKYGLMSYLYSLAFQTLKLFFYFSARKSLLQKNFRNHFPCKNNGEQHRDLHILCKTIKKLPESSLSLRLRFLPLPCQFHLHWSSKHNRFRKRLSRLFDY
jgi:hypothetical protein